MGEYQETLKHGRQLEADLQGWIPGGGLTWDEMGEYQETLKHGRQLEADLQGWIRVSEWRQQRKRQLARQVLAGQLSLLEAAAQFRALNDQPPALDGEVYRYAYPGRNVAERHCREVPRIVEQTLTDEGIASPAVLDRLRDELCELLARPAPLRLPPNREASNSFRR
jgi:hypothetical protein